MNAGVASNKPYTLFYSNIVDNNFKDWYNQEEIVCFFKSTFVSYFLSWSYALLATILFAWMKYLLMSSNKYLSQRETVRLEMTCLSVISKLFVEEEPKD